MIRLHQIIIPTDCLISVNKQVEFVLLFIRCISSFLCQLNIVYKEPIFLFHVNIYLKTGKFVIFIRAISVNTIYLLSVFFDLLPSLTAFEKMIVNAESVYAE